jgi:hypothetical protein
LRAYHCLGVPILGEGPDLRLAGYTEIDALQEILGGRVEENFSCYFEPARELEPDDEDGLVSSIFNPNFNENGVGR